MTIARVVVVLVVLSAAQAGPTNGADSANPDQCPLVQRDQHSIWRSLDRLRPMPPYEYPAIQLESRDAFIARRNEYARAMFYWMKYQGLALGLIQGGEDEAEFVRAYSSVTTGQIRRASETSLPTVLSLAPGGEVIDKRALPPESAQDEPDADRPLVIVSCPSAHAWDVATHEAFHWVQRQRWPSLRKLYLPATDRRLGQSALVEGDASLMGLMLSRSLPFERFRQHERRAMREISTWKDLASCSQPYLRLYLPEVPSAFFRRDGSVYVLRDTFFPHIHGRIFVQEAWRRGGAKAVDGLYEAPEKWPASTEQILHPEKYFDPERFDPPREIPEVVEIDSRPPFHQDVLGEWMIHAWLASYLGPADARRAAEGWGGDRLAIGVGPGKLSSRLQTVWDSPRDSEEFEQALMKLLEIRLGGEVTFRRDGSGRLVYERGDRKVSVRRADRSVELLEEMPCAFCDGSETRASVYVIGVGDVLSISVWREPALTKPIIVVRPDGKISFPLVGDVEAAGSTPRELAQALAEGLARFIKDPVVVVRDETGREVRSRIDTKTRSIYLKPGETIRAP